MIRKSLSRRWANWMRRRLPRSDTRTFSQKTIFILPTGAGLVFGILLFIMLLTGINYQNSLIYLLVFLMGAVFVGAMHQTHRNLSGLTLALVSAGEGEAGGSLPFRLRLSSHRDDSLSLDLRADGAELRAVHVPAHQTREVTLPLPAERRGYQRPERIRIETRFPFGLLKAWSWLRPASAGVAFPTPVPVPETPGEVADDRVTDDTATRRSGQDEADLRPWREGDLSPRVMWKRYARTGQMVVADWQGQGGSPHWLDFSAFPGVDTELRLSYLAWLVRERSARAERFGLRLPSETIEPDAGEHHARHCMRRLALWDQAPPREPEPLAHGTRTAVDDGAETQGGRV